MRIIVVGAGIVGTSLAESLISRGHRVTLVDREVARGATATNYAWLNSHKKHPDSYHAINHEGLRHWTTVLAARYPDLVEFQGHVEIAGDDDHRATLTGRLERLRDLDYAAEWITPDRARRLVPVPVSDDALTGYFPAEGHTYPAHVAETIVHNLRSHDGFRLLRHAVTSVDANASSVTLDSGDVVGADIVVLCAGIGTTALAATAGVDIPLVPPEVGGASFGYLGYADAPHHGLSGLLTTDHLSLRPDGADRLILQALDLDVSADPHRDVPERVTNEFSRRLAAILPDHEMALREVRVGHRVIPADGLTVAGPISPPTTSLWVVATHSGVVLGPWLGEVIAAEISGAPPHRLLADFRPDRFERTGSAAADYRPPRRPGDQ